MCVLFVDEPTLGDGWGFCSCKTYNGIHRDACKFCEKQPCALGLAHTDIIEPREVTNE